MNVIVGTLLILIPFIILVYFMIKDVGIGNTIIILFGTALVTGMIVVGTMLLTGELIL